MTVGLCRDFLYNNIVRKSQAVRIILAALAFLFSGYYIYHPNEDLLSPEVFWPDASGQRPAPGFPMVPVQVMLDTKLADDSNNYSAALASLDTWNSVDQSTASLVYGGTILLEGDFSSRWGEEDGDNTIELVISNWFPGPGYIAYTVLHYEVATSKLTEADIFLDGEDYTWTDVYDLPLVDTQTIVTHELGHVLGLGHCQYLLPTMSVYEPPIATHKRQLHGDDKQGLRWLYAADENFIPGPSLWRMARGGCDRFFDYSSGPAVVDESTDPLGFCLYGAGFAGSDFDVQLVSERTGDVFSPASGITFSTENLLTLAIDLSQLGADSYQLTLQQEDGKSGTLRQGLIVKQVGAELPVAEIDPGETIITLNQEIMLDGSGSTDPEGDPLNYSWFLLEGSTGLIFSSQTGSTIRVTAESGGDYVVGLMVDDGVNYSLIARSVLSVDQGDGGGGGGGSGGCGCQVQGGSGFSSIASGLLPVLFLLLLRLRRFLR